MNPIKTIGRYEIPIGSVVMIERRTGWKAFFRPGYNVLLSSGVVLYMTNDEKAQLDEAQCIHGKVMEVFGMYKTLQQNNRAAA